MNTRILTTFVLLGFTSLFMGCATVVKEPDVYEVIIVDVPGTSQSDIYDKSRQWFSEYFVSGESVVDYEDKDEGTIIGNGINNNASTGFLMVYGFQYKIRIDTKDGRLKVSTRIIRHTYRSTYDGSHGIHINPSAKMISSAKANIDEQVKGIKDYIRVTQDNSGW